MNVKTIRKLLFGVALMLLTQATFGQSITLSTMSASSPHCAGEGFTLNYTTSNNFPSGNIFTAQLSSSTGTFTTPTTIGTVTDINSGSISITLPANTVEGTGYRIRIRASNGTVSGLSTAQTIRALPVITVDPSTLTQSICLGSNGSALTVGATLSTGTLNNYQWYRNASASNTGGTLISGATAATYTPTSAAAGTFYYYATATSTSGCTSVASDVSGAVTFQAVPTITATSPAARCGTGIVTLGATASAGTVNWHTAASGGSFIGTGVSFGPSLSATTVYYVDATNNGCTTATRTAITATVNTTTTINTEPSDYASCPGSNASFNVGATGTGLTYQWKENGVNITNTGIYSGATSATLNLTGLSAAKNGAVYSVQVSGTCGSVLSEVASLTVAVPTLTITNPAAVCSPNTVDLTSGTVTAGSTAGMTYTYWTNAGATTALSTPSAVVSAGTYYIKGTTGTGCATSVQPVTVTVNASPTVAVNNTAPILCTGSSVALTATGEPGNTLSFTGSNQFIKLNDDPLQNATDFTFEAWIYWTDNTTQWQRIFDFGNSTNVNMFFTPKSTSGFPRYAITIAGNGSEQHINTTTSISTNTWHHVAITYNSTSDDAYMYLDGVVIGSNTNMTIGPNNLTPKPLAFNYFGESQYAVDPNFAGKLDEIRIWNVARTTSDINTYKGTSVATNSPGLVAYYKLNEGNGSTLVSATGTSTASVQGTPTWGTSTATVSPAAGQTTVYTWTPNTALSSTSGVTVTASPTTTTTYTVTGTYTNGCSSTANSLVTVLVPSVSIAASTTSICPGTSVTFTATPTHGGTPSYSWKKNGVTVGTNAATYTTNTLVNGDVITCVMTSTGTCTSSVTSNAITMSVTSISITASATTVCTGQSVTYTAAVVNATSPAYQWRKNTIAINGATGATYTTTAIANNDVITCTMTSANCTGTFTSAGITMVVNGLPTITSQPSSTPVSYCMGASATPLSVSATGAGLTYQWYGNTTGTTTTGTLIAGATSASYTPPTSSAGTRYYYVVISGTCTPSTKSSISGGITVNGLPSISVQPTSTAQNLCLNGSSTALSVTTSGAGLSYQWYSNTTASNTGGTLISGANNANYTPPTAAVGTRYYYVVVSGTCAPSVTSSVSGAATVNVATSITAQPTVSTTICNGGNATYTVTAVGGGTLTYQWRRYGANISDNAVYSGTNTATLTITGATTAHAGDYSVNVTGSCGANPVTSNNANLVVNTAPVITSHPLFQTICENGNISYEVVALGNNLNYQWRVNGITLANAGIYSGVNTAILTLTGANNSYDANQYSVVVSNGCGTNAVSNNALLTVVPLVTPAVHLTSSATTFCSGSSVSFTATPGGGGASPSYQWRVNGVDVGANVNPYVTSSLIDGDLVSVVMTSNAQCITAPTATSSNIAVTVTPGIVNNVIDGDETVCHNVVPAGITGIGSVSGGSGSYNYQWQSSSDNVSYANIGGATTATYTPTALTVNTYFRRVVSSGTCNSISNTVFKQLNLSSFIWIGNTSTDWNTASNWCSNGVPTANDVVTINSGTVNSPIIGNFAAYAKDININSAALLTLDPGAVLEVSGNWFNNGILIPKDASTVKFTATSGTQTIVSGTQSFYNLEKTGAATLLIGATSDITIRRGGLLKIAAGTFDMNNRSVLLKSKVSVDNIDSTASLGVVTGAITNASNFKVERYNVAVRGFRYVAAPVTGVTAKTFKDSVIIAGPTAAGFDAPNTSVATIKSFVEWRNPNWSKCFVSFTNINTAIAPGSGYYLFVPAKRTTVFPANAPVSLLMKGTPITGNFNFNLYYTPTASAGWNLLGNPYPSAIDWDNAGAWTKTNVDDAIYIWDPTLGTSGSYYAYVSGISSDARDHGSVISSGQGFFVKANAAAPVLRVTENAKVSSTFAKSNFRQALSSYVTLRVTNQNGDVDYTTIRLNDETGRNLSAVKMYNSKINMYSKKVSGVDAYSINAIDDAPSFEVPIYIESTNSSVYNVEVIKVIGDINATGSLKIKDQVTGTLHDVIVGAKISLIPDGNTQRISLIRQDHVEAVVTTIGDKETDGEYQLYPTHIHGHQHPVLYMHNHHDKKIEVFNTSGERLAVHHTHHAHYAFHDFDKYGSGVYLIKVTSDHKTHTFKVMK